MKSRRLVIILLVLIVLFEGLLLIVDFGIYYAFQASTYNLPTGFSYLKDLLSAGIFICLYILIRKSFIDKSDTTNPLCFNEVGLMRSGSVVLIFIIGLFFMLDQSMPESNYIKAPNSLYDFIIPQSLLTIIKTHLITLTLGILILIGLVALERFILYKRSKHSLSNFLGSFVLIFLFGLSLSGKTPQEPFTIQTVAFGVLSLILIAVNSFRISWILPLSRPDKWKFSGFILILTSTVFVLYKWFDFPIHFVWFSSMTGYVLLMLCIYLLSYLTVSFFGILIYLPSSRDYERKTTEIRNLYAMSKFITDVFDEEKIYDSLLTYICSSIGDSAKGWLDIYDEENLDRLQKNARQNYESVTCDLNTTFRNQRFHTVHSHQIKQITIDDFAEKADFIWKDIVTKKDVIKIEDITSDKRIRDEKKPIHTFWRRIRRIRHRDRHPLSSMVSVPLISRNRLIGIVHIAKDVEFGFVKDDLELIITFADQAAVAIDNSRLFKQLIEKERLKQELLIAENIQERLLPQNTLDVPGFEISSLFYPAYEVGGDYYDYFELEGQNSDKYFGIIVADVSGKGTFAAFYMAELKGIIQSLSSVFAHDPEELIRRANDTLVSSLGKNVFISLIYGLVNATTKKVILTNAGHCPVVAYTDNTAQLIKLDGLALGLRKGKIFNSVLKPKTLQLQSGDVMVFYTDGLIEAINQDKEEFGYNRLKETVAKNKHLSAEEIKNTIFDAVNTFAKSGESNRDDLTIVVLKVL